MEEICKSYEILVANHLIWTVKRAYFSLGMMGKRTADHGTSASCLQNIAQNQVALGASNYPADGAPGSEIWRTGLLVSNCF